MIEPPRRAPWTVALDLYRGGGSFRGFLEFALIGAVVLWFVNGGAGTGFRDLMGIFKSAPSGTSTGPVPGRPSADLAKMAKPEIPIAPRISDLKIEPSYFDAIEEPLRGKLVAAIHAYYQRDSRGAANAIVDADPDHKTVLFMRGLVQLSIPGADSIAGGVRLLEQAIAKGEPRAMAVMGVLKVAGLPGIPRDNAGGRALLEDAVAAGDAIAPRVIGEGYITGWMGMVDPARAEKNLRLASDRGDARGMYRLGEMYLMGQGVPKNEIEAEKMIRKAATAGFAEAQAMLGVLRFIPYGNEVTDDPSEALGWFERAADQGEPHGLYYLGMFYIEFGKRVNRLDPPRGVEYLRRCVEQTLYHECVFAYGTALDFGIGTARDPVKAYAMYSISSARENAGKSRARRDEVGKSLTAAQIFEAGVIADFTMRKPITKPLRPSSDLPTFTQVKGRAAAEGGSADAQIDMGVARLQAYANGNAAAAEEARNWFRHALKLGEPIAALYLGLLELDPKPDLVGMTRRLGTCSQATLDVHCLLAYGAALQHGIGVPRDAMRASVMYGLAFEHTRIPAAKAKRDAVYNTLNREQIELEQFITAEFIARLPADVRALAKPPLPPPPESEIVRKLREDSANGDPAATIRLADRLRSGRGVARDLAEAERLFKVAADAGHGEAAAMLGVLELIASGFDKAKPWFRRAAEAGDPAGMLYLGVFASGGPNAPSLTATEAADWFRRCGELALNGQCLYAYATAREYGLGVERDPVLAFVMYALAAQFASLPRAVAKREELRAELGEATVARSKEISIPLWRKSRPGMARLNELSRQ
jgi:TPR repeat protein